MDTGDKKQLTERQELLLSRYYDGEASFFDGFLAKRLLKTNASAPTFLASLQSLTTETTATVAASDVECDLWHRISARIEAEEKAAIYLGNRAATPTPQKEGFFANLLSSHALVGGFSGAAVAAVLVLSLTPLSPSKNVPVIPVDSSTIVSASSGFKPVALENEGGSPRAVKPLTPMELDWMRGAGTLKIIQSPQSPSGVIWVNRQKRAKAVVSPAPSPFNATRQQKGLDVKAPNRPE